MIITITTTVTVIITVITVPSVACTHHCSIRIGNILSLVTFVEQVHCLQVPTALHISIMSKPSHVVQQTTADSQPHHAVQQAQKD